MDEETITISKKYFDELELEADFVEWLLWNLPNMDDVRYNWEQTQGDLND